MRDASFVYVRLLGLLPLLASCSLINSYDDVIEGGAGAGNGGGDPSTTNATTTGSTTSTGMGGDNSGGGGGANVTPLECQLVGLPDELFNLGGEPQGFRTFQDRGFAWQPNGDRLRFVTMVGDELRGYEVVTTSGALSGPPWVLPGVDDMIDAREMTNDTTGILVTRRPPMQGDPIPVELHTIGNQGFGNPGSFPIATYSTADQGSVRGRFVHVGPEPNRVDLLLRTTQGPNNSVFYFKHMANGTNSANVPIVTNPPFVDADESSPAGLVRVGNRVHVFVGEPDPDGKSVRHWSFVDDANQCGEPIPLGAPGVLFLDSAVAGNMVNLALAQVTETTLGAYLGKVPDSALDDLTLADLHAAKQFDSFLDIPTAGRPSLVNDMFPLFGPNQTKTEFMLILSRTTDGAVRFDDPEFLQPKSPSARFGDMGLLATDDPVINLGGILYIIYSERENAGEANEYDSLQMATVTCEPR